VPTVVAVGTERAQVARMVRTTFTSFNNVIDDQPAADTAARRSAVPRYALVAIPNEHMCPQPFPSLSAIEGIMRRLPLVRSGRPAGWSERWWSSRHDRGHSILRFALSPYSIDVERNVTCLETHMTVTPVRQRDAPQPGHVRQVRLRRTPGTIVQGLRRRSRRDVRGHPVRLRQTSRQA
jgi:hypothetical protein